MKIIFDYNRTLFNPETNSLFPGVFELLEELFEHCELCLVSRDEPGRTDRLEELGIKKFFQKIRFVEGKTNKLFADLVGESKNVLVVGDRVNEEIRIGNELGLTTIWIQQGMFADECPVSEPSHTVRNIQELRDLLLPYAK